MEFIKGKHTDLLQGGGAQLDGDVREEVVPFRAEIPDDVGMRVGLSQELHFTLRHLQTPGEDSLHRNTPSVKVAPGSRATRRSRLSDHSVGVRGRFQTYLKTNVPELPRPRASDVVKEILPKCTSSPFSAGRNEQRSIQSHRAGSKESSAQLGCYLWRYEGPPCH